MLPGAIHAIPCGPAVVSPVVSVASHSVAFQRVAAGGSGWGVTACAARRTTPQPADTLSSATRARQRHDTGTGSKYYNGDSAPVRPRLFRPVVSASGVSGQRTGRARARGGLRPSRQ